MNEKRDPAPVPELRPPHAVVPPYLLDAIAERGAQRFPRAASAARACRRPDGDCASLHEAGLRRVDAELESPPDTEDSPDRAGGPAPSGGLHRSVHDAQGREELPGVLVRSEGDPAGADEAVNEAYDGLGSSYRLFAEVFERDSLDGEGMPLVASVHYGQDYDNAFFDGRQMVFGDGDGEVFTGFTGSLSIIGHELSHGVVGETAGLVYQGQPGALNEHCADVFGVLTEQYELGQDAAAATWLVGAGIFTEEVQGQALRSMLEPGTAYDDDVLGKDPQPAHMDDFVATTSDNGGVHINSGIPNRAFALAAREIGGKAWEGVGQVWYAVLTGSGITEHTVFGEFAELTVAEASARFGADSTVHRAVLGAWGAVGVLEPEVAP